MSHQVVNAETGEIAAMFSDGTFNLDIAKKLCDTLARNADEHWQVVEIRLIYEADKRKK